MLDEVFEVVIVDVDWARSAVSWIGPNVVVTTSLTVTPFRNAPLAQCIAVFHVL